METPAVSCPSCHLQILPVFYFCPNCGKSLRPKPLVVSVPRQIILYLVSFFLPPAVFPYALRYLKQPNKRTKIIGGILLVIAVSSIMASLWAYIWFIQQFYSLYSQINPLQKTLY